MRSAIFVISVFLSSSLLAQQTVVDSEVKDESDSIEEVQLESAPAVKASSSKVEYKKKQLKKDQQLIQQNIQSTSNSAVFNTKNYSSSNQRMQRSPNQSQQIEMDNVVKYFDSIAPNSFEYNYFKYVSSNYDINQVSNLKEAERIRPNNTDVKSELAGYYMIKKDYLNGLLKIERLIKSEKLSKEVLLYSEDVLLSVPLNSTLITHGFDDTYSTWYTQNKKNLRKDVRIISLDFLQSEFYRGQLIIEGYKMPNSTLIDVAFFSEFCRINTSKNIVVSLTTPKEYFVPNATQFFVTGIVMSYSIEGQFNFQENEKLWNAKLKKHLIGKAINEKGKQLSANYLPMLLQMRKVYNSLNNKEMVKELDVSIDKISVQCRKYEKVQKLKGSY